MVTDDDDAAVRVELLMHPGWHISHGHGGRAGKLDGGRLPGFAHIQQVRMCIGGEKLFQLL